mgnify:CR=1 FL=1
MEELTLVRYTDLIQRFAPLVYLHSQEPVLPSSVEWVLRAAGVIDSAKRLVVPYGGLALPDGGVDYDRLLGLPASTKSILGAAVWFVLIGAFQVDGYKDAFAWDETLSRLETRRNDPPRFEAGRSDASHVQPQRSCGILAFETSGTC